MIEFSNGGRLVQCLGELPDPRQWRVGYVDFETTSGDPKLSSLDPWHHCQIAGVAVTGDECPNAWYVPIGHHDERWNLPRDNVLDWLFDLLNSIEIWRNSGVKYDAHVAANAGGILYDGIMEDLPTLAKLVNSDRFAYGLKLLSKEWTHHDIGHHAIAMEPFLYRNKDYGRVPADVMGDYACDDVLSARRVAKYCLAHIPEEAHPVWETEIKVTSMLFDIEREGMRVDPQQVLIKQLTVMNQLTTLDELLTERVGWSFRPDQNGDCFDVLCTNYGLPVLAWTDDGNPSFAKDTLKQYAAHPAAPHDVIKMMRQYRTLWTLNTYFIEPFLKLNVDGVLHSDYNQTVRTGRMSCRRPNAQQQSKLSKQLIIPKEGEVIVSPDLSQIEFRLIAHYINNPEWVRAYNENPNTDAHNWVAGMCGIPRRPAKTVNFQIGYGAGERSVVASLTTNLELMEDLKEQIDPLATKDEQAAQFVLLAAERAKGTYDNYHATLPELKWTSNRAESACRRRGWVRNLYGRRRHLPAAHAYKAFNSLCQSSAADLIKERAVALHEALKGTGARIFGVIHDACPIYAPAELAADPRFARDVCAILERQQVELRVPVRTSCGISARHWAEADSDEASRLYETKHADVTIGWAFRPR